VSSSSNLAFPLQPSPLDSSSSPTISSTSTPSTISSRSFEMGLKKGFFSASPSAAKAAAHPPNSVALATNPSSTAPTAGTTPTSSATHMGLKRGFFSKIQTLGLSSPSTSQQQSAVSSVQDFKSLSAQFAALAPSSTTDNYPQYIANEYESDSEISLAPARSLFSRDQERLTQLSTDAVVVNEPNDE